VSIPRRISSLFRNLFRRSHVERELTDELRGFVETLTDQHVRAGMSPDAARRAALVEVGGIEQVKEQVRDVRTGALIEQLLQDLRYALRVLRKSPAFTAVAVLSLGIGIGANTAIFSVIDAVLLKSLPIRDPGSLVIVQRLSRGPDGKTGARAMPYPSFARVRAENHVMTAMAASAGAGNITLAVNGAAERLPHGVLVVTGDFFPVLGIVPYRGRLLGPDDDRTLGAHPVAVLSYGYWQTRFGGDESIVGRTVRINDAAFTIVGITPAKFFGLLVGDTPDVYAPMMMDSVIFRARSGVISPNNGFLTVIGRLKPGVTRAQAGAELGPLYVRARIETSGGVVDERSLKLYEGTSIDVQAGGGGLGFMRNQYGPSLRILMAMVALLLLIACGNIANLLLARASARRREIAVRVSLGAGRARLIRQLLTESVLLGVAGGALGLGFAQWGNKLLIGVISSGVWPVIDLSPDGRILAFTAAVAIGTGLLFGIAPALGATRVEISPALKNAARGTIGVPHARLGRAMVVAQIGLSLVLIAGTGLFVRSLSELRSVDMGFDRERVLLVRLDPRRDGYSAERAAAFYRELLERAKRIGGVREAALAEMTPMEGSRNSIKFSVPGYIPADSERMNVFVVNVSPEYFTVLGATLRSGRVFDRAGGDVPVPLVVNAAFSERYLREGGVLGRSVSLVGPDESKRDEAEVVGVVRNLRLDNLRDSVPPAVFRPFFDGQAVGRAHLLLRTASAPVAIAAQARALVREMDPRLEVLTVRTLVEQVDNTLLGPRLVATISTFFGLVALALAAIGLYGVLSYAVSRRTSELGLRMALGASPGSVRWMVLRQTAGMVAIGIAVGVPLIVVLGRLVQGFLFGLRPTDPLTLAVAIGVLAAVAAVAGFLPAQRAARVDPIVALRSD
jgi:predicted permease